MNNKLRLFAFFALISFGANLVLSIPVSSDGDTGTNSTNATIAPETTTATTIYTPPIINKICKGQPVGTYMIDPSNHSVFYECGAHGIAHRFECPHPLVFDVEKKICIFDSTGTTERVPDHGKSKFDCKGKENGFYPDPADRHKFHQCQNGYPSDFDCPPTTVFDPVKGACVYEH